MAETILFSLAEEVLKKLGSDALTEISSAWGFKTQLNKLKSTTNTLKNVLLDAEERQSNRDAVDSHAVGDWLERLSTIVYAADDLSDEFNAVAARKQLKGGHKLTKEVCAFFSHSNQVALAFKLSRKIKKIREQLDGIEKDGKWFSFVPRSLERGSATSRRRDDQTTAYVVVEDKVIDRKDGKEAILKMLFESSSTGHENGHDEGLPVISIVGMGGMEKTILAQLVCDDPQVKEYFDLILWVCISDVLDIKVIIKKLLESATYEDHPNLDIDLLHGRLRNKVDGKKCLFVLDDIWNDQLLEWVELSSLLKIGRKGSKILVTTTRLSEVARIVGPSSAYDLEELTEENSWKLFEKMAFISPEEAQQKSNLVKIGKEIIKKCRGVPLAIKTLGCLLYDKEEEEWLSIKDKDKSLAKILDSQNNIKDILKLSYHHLSSPLKNCFAYCALFPKDYRFKKETLIDLWIAEEFITLLPSNDDQSLDEVAEDYFHILLRRGFFQDIERNGLEEIESCKLHDFMHDLAQDVAGVKCKVAMSNERNFDEKSVHFSLAHQLTPLWEIPSSMLNMKLMRTFLLPEQKVADWSPWSKSISLLTKFRSLRVLDLSEVGLKSLPNSIGKLVHLRYLNLSKTCIEKLPDSITDLWNLQTLRLYECRELKALPANMKKLTNLRCLDVDGIYSSNLSHMPTGLGGLTSLNSLPKFIVGASDERYNSSTAKLSDLKNLKSLKGFLEIDIQRRSENNILEARGADYLSNKHGLTKLCVSFSCYDDEFDCNYDEVVLEGLKPPSNLKHLSIGGYRGQNLPSWARMDNLCTTLPYLVTIEFWYCSSCQQLPALSQLRFLKSLVLVRMETVEYMESDDVSGVPSSIFFPSLEHLDLSDMMNLKGWWKEVKANVNGNEAPERATNEVAAQQIPRTFSKLSSLRIEHCPKLRKLPFCPNLEGLVLRGTIGILAAASSTSSSGFKLEQLFIHEDGKAESTETERLGDVFTTLSSSLVSLEFLSCNELRSIPKGLEHLTALVELTIAGCEELEDEWRGEEEKEEGMPWKSLNTSLHSLTLSNLPRGIKHLSNLRSLCLLSSRSLEELPEGMNCLSSLECLQFYNCPKLKALPEWISCLSSLESLTLEDCPKLTSLPEAFRQLTSLNQLEIVNCPGLKARCQEGPNGADWPKIQHISLLSVRDEY